MPRLVQIVTSPLTAFALMRGQLAYLQSHGFEVTLVTAPEPAALLKAVAEREEVEVVTVPLRREISPAHDLAALVRLFLLLRRLRPPIVNAGTPKAGLLGMVAARLARVPNRVYTLRGLRLETTRGPLRRFLALAERAASGSANRIVCVSRSLCTEYHRLGFGAGKTAVLASGSSNGIDLERFDRRAPGEVELESLRRRLGLGGSEAVIGFVGRLTRDKGIGDLVDAFTGLVDRRPEARLLLLGDFERGDRLAADLRQRIADHPAILRLAFVDDPRPYYGLMHLLALPSYREGFPNSVIEAGAARLPVVAYDATGTVDAVVDGRTGRLVARGDRDALAAAIFGYLDDAETRRLHGEAARLRVERLFQSHTVWQAWLEFFRSLPTAPDQ